MPNWKPSRVTPEQAAQEVLNRREARRHLIDFATYVDPTFQRAPHLALIADYLEHARRREILRLIIEAPPRHGKSKEVSEMFPAWALGKDASEQFMLTSHTASLPETFSRNVRNLIASDRYQALFPETRLSKDSATIEKWTLDGFTRPAMLTVGVGGSPTGQGAKILIVDDPIGSSDEAESALQRKNLYTWYTETIYPRLEPNAVIIIMMQRWHEDDLTGRLLHDQERADKWVLLSLPALAEPQAVRDEYAQRVGLPLGQPDPLGRQPDEALWPERFPRKVLYTIKAVSLRSFEAKYQQKPRPAEGNKFKRAWLRTVDSVPGNLKWVRYWDLAYGQKQQNDNTATISAAFGEDGTIYLRRGRAGHLESPDARRLIKEFMKLEPHVEHGVENKMHGGPVVQDLLRDKELVSFSFRAVNIHGDKVVRATPVIDRAESGKVAFVRENVNDDVWITEWIDELCGFPFAAKDDRVDAVSGCFEMLSPQVKEEKTETGEAQVVDAHSLF
jgi:predicted phage terminase large subunit-like protein